jgi:hypothetical protein
MRFRPLAVLCRFWLGLLLLAGAAVLGGAPQTVQAAAAAAELSQRASGLKARLQHDDQSGPAVLDPAWSDADDDSKALPFTAASIAPTPSRQPLVIKAASPRPAPLSHWPCAGTPTGPPRS